MNVRRIANPLKALKEKHNHLDIVSCKLKKKGFKLVVRGKYALHEVWEQSVNTTESLTKCTAIDKIQYMQNYLNDKCDLKFIEVINIITHKEEKPDSCHIKYLKNQHIVSYRSLMSHKEPTVQSAVDKEYFITQQYDHQFYCKQYKPSNRSIIQFNCRLHGTQTCTLHRWYQGGRCKKCSKEFKLSKRQLYLKHYPPIKQAAEIETNISKLYIIRLSNDEENFIKLGVTKRSLKKRFSSLTKYYKLEKLNTYRLPNIPVYEIEKTVHKYFKDKRYEPKNRFCGFTECYKIEDYKNVLLKLSTTLNEYSQTM